MPFFSNALKNINLRLSDQYIDPYFKNKAIIAY